MGGGERLPITYIIPRVESNAIFTRIEVKRRTFLQSHPFQFSQHFLFKYLARSSRGCVRSFLKCVRFTRRIQFSLYCRTRQTSIQRRPREANNLFTNFSLRKLNLTDQHKHTRYQTPADIYRVFPYTNIYIFLLYYCK